MMKILLNTPAPWLEVILLTGMGEYIIRLNNNEKNSHFWTSCNNRAKDAIVAFYSSCNYHKLSGLKQHEINIL